MWTLETGNNGGIVIDIVNGNSGFSEVGLVLPVTPSFCAEGTTLHSSSSPQKCFPVHGADDPSHIP